MEKIDVKKMVLENWKKWEKYDGGVVSVSRGVVKNVELEEIREKIREFVEDKKEEFENNGWDEVEVEGYNVGWMWGEMLGWEWRGVDYMLEKEESVVNGLIGFDTWCFLEILRVFGCSEERMEELVDLWSYEMADGWNGNLEDCVFGLREVLGKNGFVFGEGGNKKIR